MATFTSYIYRPLKVRRRYDIQGAGDSFSGESVDESEEIIVLGNFVQVVGKLEEVNENLVSYCSAKEM